MQIAPEGHITMAVKVQANTGGVYEVMAGLPQLLPASMLVFSQALRAR